MRWVRTLGMATLCILMGQVVLGNAPTQSLHPTARPMGITSYVVRETTVPVYYHATIRPKPRPVAGARPRPEITTASRAGAVILAAGVRGLARSPRPKARPKNMRRTVVRAQETQVRVAREVRGPRRGSVCGDRAIRGQAIARIRGQINGCGIANPVRITAVDGVLLSTPATMDCDTARALKSWVHNGAKPAVGRMGGGIKSLRVVAHYACRTRNNQRGARLSEHAKGKAIDIAAINLKNGTSLTVLSDWRNRRPGRVLKRMHQAACGPFGTVLGPNANRYHQDHFHFDTADYRSGPYCR